MSETLPLGLDELLTTTRSVRRRLDFSKPIAREVIEQCVEIAMQAPTPSNLQNWHFVIVRDPVKRMALADLYRKGREIYVTLPSATANVDFGDPARNAIQQRIEKSAQYLNKNFQEAPVLVVPCIEGRTDLPADAEVPGWGHVPSVLLQSAQWGSIAPATWSFMLAARARGLGTCWTSLHLYFEEEAADILGIPYPDVMQACLLPLAYTKGTNFRSGKRDPLDSIVHWDDW
ncbi:MAG TPA: nitroreductase [Gammaproteobacteria bacterium]|nr:nitroreductase [Gammaproteobacteria bacterium]|tara:strand:+ start:254 stop:946 length:693 start_codon:yes stop_codon:yes gene_type:complete